MANIKDQAPGLANLEPAEPGNIRAVTHGAHSERMIGPVVSDVAAEVELLCAGTQLVRHSSRRPAPCWPANWPDCAWSANTSKRTTTCSPPTPPPHGDSAATPCS